MRTPEGLEQGVIRNRRPENLMPPSPEELLDILTCPNCGEDLGFSQNNQAYECLSCETIFPVEDGVLALLPSGLEENKRNEDKMYKYWMSNGEMYERWVESAHKHEDITFFREDFLSRHGHAIKGRVLEIGAGVCWASSIIKLKFPFVKIIASDVSLTALKEGRKLCSTLNSNVDHFVACDVERLPFKDETFNAVFGASIIHHLPNPWRGVAEVHRILEKEGTYFGLDFGLGGVVANKIRRVLCRSRFWPTGWAERTFKIVDNTLSFEEWRSLYDSAGFRDVKLTLERKYITPPARHDYKIYRLTAPYYKITSLLPDNFVKLFLASGVGITAEK